MLFTRVRIKGEWEKQKDQVETCRQVYNQLETDCEDFVRTESPLDRATN